MDSDGDNHSRSMSRRLAALSRQNSRSFAEHSVMESIGSMGSMSMTSVQTSVVSRAGTVDSMASAASISSMSIVEASCNAIASSHSDLYSDLRGNLSLGLDSDLRRAATGGNVLLGGSGGGGRGGSGVGVGLGLGVDLNFERR